MKKLIEAAWKDPEAEEDFSHRVMLAIARAEQERLHRRARWTAIAAAACLAGLILTLPVESLVDGIGGTIDSIKASVPAIENL